MSYVRSLGKEFPEHRTAALATAQDFEDLSQKIFGEPTEYSQEIQRLKNAQTVSFTDIPLSKER